MAAYDKWYTKYIQKGIIDNLEGKAIVFPSFIFIIEKIILICYNLNHKYE